LRCSAYTEEQNLPSVAFGVLHCESSSLKTPSGGFSTRSMHLPCAEGGARLGRLALEGERSLRKKGTGSASRQARLVVLVLDLDAADALLGVDLFLHLEDKLEEELVQLLVGEVDAQLLERVDLEDSIA
jgi:hypothetical protein